MKGKLAWIAGLGVLAAAAPALAGGKPDLFPNEATCLAMGASRDHFAQWEYACIPWPDGRWELVWTNTRHKNK